MTEIAFFGHDAADSAVRRRARAMKDDGFDVVGYMMRRQDDVNPEWTNIDLGRTYDAAMVARLRSIWTGAKIAAAEPRLRKADLIYARNLDMLITAFLAKRHAKLDTPVIYEALDVHRLLAKPTLVGVCMRALERRFIKRSKGLVVSSPGFLTNYYERYHKGLYRPFMVENKMTEGAEYGPRPDEKRLENGRPLVLGWVGMLRCKRSFDLLCDLADRFPDDLIIKMHGIPARTEIPVFEPEIEARKNIIFAGRYKAPEDLLDMYSKIDVIWAADFMDAGYNSVWLLPNRIYEGGYYGVPSIAPEGTETSRWIMARKAGFTESEPLETTLPNLVARLIADKSDINKASAALLGLDETEFVQKTGFMKELVDYFFSNSQAAA